MVKQKRCKNCLKQFHRSEHCFDDNYCVIKSCSRTDKHSPCVCRQRFPKSVWSELYHHNISRYKGKNAERNPTSTWTELYHRNISEFLSEAKSDKLNKNDCKVNKSSMTVSTSQSEGKFASIGTQTDDELCSPLPPKITHHSEESQRNSSFVNVCEHERFQSIVFNFLEILCSMCHNWGVQNSFNAKPKMTYSNFPFTKDNFMDILT